jgi:hypothetical protein
MLILSITIRFQDISVYSEVISGKRLKIVMESIKKVRKKYKLFIFFWWSTYYK